MEHNKIGNYQLPITDYPLGISETRWRSAVTTPFRLLVILCKN